MTGPERPRTRLLLWLAEGLGSGRLRKAPGTWGSLVGLAWFALLLLPGHPVFFWAGLLLAAALAVPLCTFAEQHLGETDPGRVVLDEIVAIPVCFVPWVLSQAQLLGHFPDLSTFLRLAPPWLIPAGFAAFRLFDIWKPFPIRQVQHLPRGWGIVADDLLAAAWVALLGLSVTG